MHSKAKINHGHSVAIGLLIDRCDLVSSIGGRKGGAMGQ